jgi:hypothetical protein
MFVTGIVMGTNGAVPVALLISAGIEHTTQINDLPNKNADPYFKFNYIFNLIKIDYYKP